MSNIFDKYTAQELRNIFIQDEWPEDFSKFVHEDIAYELLDSWLESVDDDIYKEKVRGIIEDITYDHQDENGNKMLEFNVENNT